MDTSIYTKIFGGDAVTDEYIPACDKLLKALREEGEPEEGELYERVGFAFLETDKKVWGYYFIEKARRVYEKYERNHPDANI